MDIEALFKAVEVPNLELSIRRRVDLPLSPLWIEVSLKTATMHCYCGKIIDDTFDYESTIDTFNKAIKRFKAQ